MRSRELTKEFESRWQTGGDEPDVFSFLRSQSVTDVTDVVSILLLDQHYRWSGRQPFTVEDYLSHLEEFPVSDEHRIRLAESEFLLRHRSGECQSVDEFAARFPDIGASLCRRLQDAATLKAPDDAGTSGQAPVEPDSFTLGEHALTRIGRYRVTRILGEGSYGRVYLGFDEELERHVAVKVPAQEWFQSRQDAESLLAEARTVAGLSHPNIVPVHDVGRTQSGGVYVVSRFIEGPTLRQKLQQDSVDYADVVSILTAVAEALDHAHQRGVIHCDVKPGNILLEEKTGIAFLADFGLAVREYSNSHPGRIVGTPAYMSPEQARAEWHRIDGRTDIYSLGAILYLALTGRKAFSGSTVHEILKEVATTDPPPPRDLNPSVPPELERICMKAMAGQMSDRYSSARELADDLLNWRCHPQESHRERQIVPRGLRSFEMSDADFFHELLPGPRNRDGIPESISFWKKRIEETDPDRTFSVGLMYGPSGSGKSSLVKAGLIPCLSVGVKVVYIEATPSETELRIIRGIRKHYPDLNGNLDLTRLLFLIRQDQRRRVVIIIDQFEQWLHANRSDQTADLVSALRQCNGSSLKAVVMVRDDFAMTAARFMDAIDIPIVQGQNFETVDLFDETHALTVLRKFGQAFGRLPLPAEQLTADRKAFLRSVVSGLSRDGKVIPIQLALFAEMIRNKPWSPATLIQVGGTDGVGINYLEETFCGRSANPKHIQHAQAAREVLRALLPESGLNIKGHMRSQSELIVSSGYQEQPELFEELVRLLDSELRLITPTDSGGKFSESGERHPPVYYQLTHDYLVPSLHEWLNRKRLETRSGRMSLLLEERTTLWSRRQEPKQLPTFSEWLGILRYTSRASWSQASRAMIRAATNRHVRHLLTAFGTVCLLTLLVFFVQRVVQQEAKVTKIRNTLDELWTTQAEHVPGIVASLAAERPLWVHDVREMAEAEHTPVSARARAMLLLSDTDDRYLRHLTERMLDCDEVEQSMLRHCLSGHQRAIAEAMWNNVPETELTRAQIIRAGALLATFSENDARWDSFSHRLSDALARSDPFEVQSWLDALRPVRHLLQPHLTDRCLDSAAPSGHRSLAARILAEFGEGDMAFPDENTLVELALTSETSVRTAVQGVISERRERILPVLLREIEADPGTKSSGDSQRRVRRKAAAVEQARQLGYEAPFWKHLNDSADPRIRTVLIDDFSHIGLSMDEIRSHLQSEPPRCRQAIVLGLPLRFPAFSESQRNEIITLLLQLYRTDPDAGVHSAIEYALRNIDAEAQLFGVQQLLADTGVKCGNWRVLTNGLCMVELPATNSSDDNSNSSTDPTSSAFGFSNVRGMCEISTTEITVRHYHEFRIDAAPAMAVTGSPDCPMNNLSLFEAMQYCRWLSEQEPDFDPDFCAYPEIDKIRPDMQLPSDYQQRAGFRLPTVDEWQYAVNAGSTTSRFFGDSDEHLSSYAWWVFNSEERVWPVGLKRPNPWGLFDTYGNVREWCHDTGALFSSTQHPVYGGEYRSTQRFLGTAIGEHISSRVNFSTQGFRVVRIRPNS